MTRVRLTPELERRVRRIQEQFEMQTGLQMSKQAALDILLTSNSKKIVLRSKNKRRVEFDFFG